jgi:hypothetical protein
VAEDKSEKSAQEKMAGNGNLSFSCCGLFRTGKVVVCIDFILSFLMFGGLTIVLKNSFIQHDNLISGDWFSSIEDKLSSVKDKETEILILICIIFFICFHFIFGVLFLSGLSKVRNYAVLLDKFKILFYRQRNCRLILPYVITAGFQAILITLLVFIVPNFVVIALAKIYIVYVAIQIFMVMYRGGREPTNNSINDDISTDVFNYP